MDIDLERRLSLKDKLFKTFTDEEVKAYYHRRYERDREKMLEYQKEYYQKHKKELQKKGRNYYRKKCGLKEEI